MKRTTSPNNVNLPYFDYLLAALADDDEIVGKCFGRHVHWGYWERPENALNTADDFAAAAENLSFMVCTTGRVQDGQTLLDVGCGFGGTIALINENFRQMSLLGLNLDDRQLARAKNQVLPLGRNTIQFQQGDACRLPFPDQSFDTVLAVECIFHFPDRAAFFKEAFRVLKPGGFLALSDFVPEKLILPLTRINLAKFNFPGFYGRCNLEYSTENYRNLAAETGFTVSTELDITRNTLPTYRYLRSSGSSVAGWKFSAILETLTVEVLSRCRLLRYWVYGFEKPDTLN